jgi:hypothetical protein
MSGLIARGRWRRPILWLTLGIIVIVACAGLWGSLGVRRTARYLAADLRALRQELRQHGRPSAATASAVRRDVEDLERTLRLCERVARSLPTVRGWPWLAARLSAAKNGLAAAVDLSAVTWWALLRMESAAENQGLINIASGTPLVMDDDPVRAAVSVLPAQAARLKRAQQALQQAASDLRLGGRGLSRWTSRAEAVAWAVDLVGLLPRLLGEDERLYLVILQNSDELRATGGFISGVVALRLEGARLVSVDYANSYDIAPGSEPHPPPPAPLQEIMQAPVLVFRDANWSPDFPASAAVLASLYQLDTGEAVSGIVALDTGGVQALMAALGSFAVPGYDVTVTAENVIETAIAFWETPLDAPSILARQTDFGAWLARRKDFSGALMQAARDRLGQLQPLDWLDLAVAAREAAAGKHLMAWSVDDAAQQGLTRMGLAGPLLQARGDYLMVVDTNMGWNKADRAIARSIAYEVRLGDEPEARACVTYRHTAETPLERCEHRAQYLDSYQALTQQCYWNYARLLAPSGSQLLALEGGERAVETEQVSGVISWGTLLVTPAAAERTLCATYSLPATVVQAQGERQVYRLTVQKQAGTAGVPIRVTVRLPHGAHEIASEIAEASWRLDAANEATLEDTLQTDRSYALSWRAP